MLKSQSLALSFDNDHSSQSQFYSIYTYITHPLSSVMTHSFHSENYYNTAVNAQHHLIISEYPLSPQHNHYIVYETPSSLHLHSITFWYSIIVQKWGFLSPVPAVAIGFR